MYLIEENEKSNFIVLIVNAKNPDKYHKSMCPLDKDSAAFI